MDAELMHRLLLARVRAEWPMIVMAAMRCMSHNFALGSEASSAHLKGREIDLAICNRRMLRDITRTLRGCGLRVARADKGRIHVRCA
jgi:hypothetical protein